MNERNRFRREDLGDVEAGRLPGRECCRTILDRRLPLPQFLADFRRKLREWGTGILRVERVDFERDEFLVTVAGDLHCSGPRASGETVCDFAEGFSAGVWLKYTGREFRASEIGEFIVPLSLGRLRATAPRSAITG